MEPVSEKINVLIVDDSKAMRMIVKRTLRQAGFDGVTTEEATNGAEALQVTRMLSTNADAAVRKAVTRYVDGYSVCDACAGILHDVGKLRFGAAAFDPVDDGFEAAREQIGRRRFGVQMQVDAGRFDLGNPDWPIATRSRPRPPARLGVQSDVRNALICDGCVVHGTVEHSVLSPGVMLKLTFGGGTTSTACEWPSCNTRLSPRIKAR